MLHQMRSAAKYIWIIMAVAFIGGFLLAETSGLLGRSAVTTSTIVAKVNGTEIPYLTWANASAQMAQQQEQSGGHSLTLDERRQIDDRAFEQLVTEALFQQEYEKRGIRVTDEEIVDQAKYNPPEQFRSSPQLQTEGQFDPAKYQRFLASPAARQQGMLAQLEGYYRAELPKQKLLSQIGGDVYVSDARLWGIYKDGHDSAAVSLVKLTPNVTDEAIKAVSDADARSYYNAHKKSFERAGRAVLSIVSVSRTPTAADTVATRARIEALRAEIAKGAKFEDVAKRESDDSVSGKLGGDLGMGTKGRFVKPFEDAAAKLGAGELSAPILTQFGYHLLKMEKKKGDSTQMRHILKTVKQGDTAATLTDRRADSLSKMGGGTDQPAKFDAAAKALGLLVSKIEVRDGSPATFGGQIVPSASAWAFMGAKVGESSDLFDDEHAYYLVRLDSLVTGGVADFDAVKADVKTAVAREQSIDKLMATAKTVSADAATSTLEAAATKHGQKVETQGAFVRTGVAPMLGALSEAVGVAFTLPVGAVSGAVRTDGGVYVMRVDRRTDSSKDEWAKQKESQREQTVRGMREQKVRMFMESLRKAAKIDDRRKQIQSAQRRQS